MLSLIFAGITLSYVMTAQTPFHHLRLVWSNVRDFKREVLTMTKALLYIVIISKHLETI